MSRPYLPGTIRITPNILLLSLGNGVLYGRRRASEIRKPAFGFPSWGARKKEYMMTFFTGKGDGGTTKLFDTPSGQRVTKSSPIFECLGQLDELNTIIGWCKIAAPKDFLINDRPVEELLHEVQDFL